MELNLLGFLAHLLGINRMRQVIWMYLSLFRNLIFTLEKIKEELEKLMHFKIDIINFRDSFKQYILILRVYSASQLFK